MQDNLNTHVKGAFYEHLGVVRAGELSGLIDFIYTPKHGSWLNMAEIEFSALSRQCLNRRIGTVEAMREQTQAWTQHRNKEQTKINWSFSVAAAREKLDSQYKNARPEN